MAIQHVRALAQKAATQTVAAYAFRNSSEVLECARSLCKVTASTRRDQDLIVSTSQQIAVLYDKLNNLRTLIAQARYALQDIPDQRITIKELERLQRELTDKFIDLCKENQSQATASAPADWLHPTIDLCQQLKQNLSRQCRKIEIFELVARTEQATEWCRYVRLCGFTDDLGNTSAERWVCFSTRNNRFWVSVHNNLCLPLTFTPHREYHDVREAVTQIRTLLAGEGCDSLTENLQVPIKRLQVQKLLGTDIVQSVSVDNEHVVVVLRPKVYRQHLDKAVKTVCDKLSTCVPHQTLVKRNQVGKNWVLRISFVADVAVKSKALSVRQIQGLRMLGFDDQAIADFADCITRRE